MTIQLNKLFKEISSLTTEKNNPRSRNIDLAETKEILKIINDEDHRVPEAVKEVIPDIAEAVEIVSKAFHANGRLFYVGAGTSGRLGVLDASECPPTFGVEQGLVNGIIAGGRDAMFEAQEGAEDSYEKGAEEIISLTNLSENDVVCGIAASGRTPYVRGAVNKAHEIGCKTLFVSTSTKEHLNDLGINADVMICPNVGPEVVAGSTRMKSGTAQKLVLNMITTASMIKLGKTYGNVMVDLQQTNKKLIERSKRIIMDIADVDYETAGITLSKANGNVKTALFMLIADMNPHDAKKELEKADGFIRKALINNDIIRDLK